MSYDGVTWIPLDEYRKGDLVPGASSDCTEPTPSLYRWVQTDDTICVNSFTGKFRAKYANGQQTYEIPCDGNTILTQSDVRGGYAYSALTDVEIGSCVTALSGQPFLYCYALSSVTIADSVLDLGVAFYGCRSLKNISIPLTTQRIEHQCFMDCSGLTEIYIPNSVTYMGSSVFSNCYGLKSAIIGNGVQEIRSDAFGSCTGLTGVRIGTSVTSIGSDAFHYCESLQEVEIPDNVVTIGQGAFASCYSLFVASIGSGVTSIGKNAFSWCNALREVVVKPTTPPTLGGNIFVRNNLSAIYIPQGTLSAYQAAEYWSNYSSLFVEI